MCSLFEDRGEYVDCKLHLISKKFIQEVKGAGESNKKEKKKGKLEGKDTELYIARSALIWAMPPLFFFILSTGLLPDLSTLLHFWWLSVQPPSPLSWQIKTLLTGPLLIVAFSITGVTENCHIHAWASLMISYFPRMKTNSRFNILVGLLGLMWWANPCLFFYSTLPGLACLSFTMEHFFNGTV